MRRIGDDKRGQEMTLGTIIAIVLGIAVLVFLIFGFSSGWNNLWSKVTMHTSVANVEDKIADCKNDCSLNEQSAWCSEKKDLRFFDSDGKIVKVKGTCVDFKDGKFEGDDSGITGDTTISKKEIDEDKLIHDAIAGLDFPSCSITCTSPASPAK